MSPVETAIWTTLGVVTLSVGLGLALPVIMAGLARGIAVLFQGDGV